MSQTPLPPENKEALPSSGSPDQNKPKLFIPVWAKVLLMFSIVFVASIGYFRGQPLQDAQEARESTSNNPEVDRRVPAPEAEFITRMGSTVKLSSLKGKVVLVSFWAHWCAPCLVELPSFKALTEQLGSKEFVVLPINIDTSKESDEFIKNFWQDKSLPFETYFDPEKKAAKAFKIETLPANFVLDREGRVVMASFGSNDWSNDSTVEMIESLLNEQSQL